MAAARVVVAAEMTLGWTPAFAGVTELERPAAEVSEARIP